MPRSSFLICSLTVVSQTDAAKGLALFFMSYISVSLKRICEQLCPCELNLAAREKIED